MKSLVTILAILLSLLASLHAADALRPLPMRHLDFVPSSERPAGLRGDGTGA